MPNQLAQSKQRVTLAEHKAVLAALEVIAKADNQTMTDLFRHTARRVISEKANDPRLSKELQRIVSEHSPKMPARFSSAAKVSKFKREQREYDQLMQELNLAQPVEIQKKNSLIKSASSVHLISIV